MSCSGDSTQITNQDQKTSSSDEKSNGGKQLKKGPWNAKEDEILSDYVRKNGEGNWNAVRKNTKLKRCGKSCRLRWANHLRSDLKKGPFSQEEERSIIEMHALMGNKWARMAAKLPGRTDNEIKNFWNTRVKRLQRAGQSIYPEDIRQSSTQQDFPNHGRIVEDGSNHSEILLYDPIAVPTVGVEDLKSIQELSPFFPAAQDMHLNTQVEIPKQIKLEYPYPSTMLDADTTITAPLPIAMDGQREDHSFHSYGNQTDLESHHYMNLPLLQSAPTELSHGATDKQVPSVADDEYVVLRSSDAPWSPISTQNRGLLDAIVHEWMNVEGENNRRRDSGGETTDNYQGDPFNPQTEDLYTPAAALWSPTNDPLDFWNGSFMVAHQHLSHEEEIRDWQARFPVPEYRMN